MERQNEIEQLRREVKIARVEAYHWRYNYWAAKMAARQKITSSHEVFVASNLFPWEQSSTPGPLEEEKKNNQPNKERGE